MLNMKILQKKKKKKERKISYVTQKYEDQQVSANHKG